MSKITVRPLLRNTVIAVAALGAASTAYASDLPSGKPFQALNERIEEVATTLQTQIDTLVAQVSVLETTTDAQGDDIDDLYFAMDVANQQLSALEAGLEGKQNLITGTCSAGSSIRAVHEDGSVECESDTGDGFKFVSMEVDVVSPLQIMKLSCPDGYLASGGGYHGASALVSVNGSLPDEDGKTWKVVVTHYAPPIPMPFYVYVSCVRK